VRAFFVSGGGGGVDLMGGGGAVWRLNLGLGVDFLALKGYYTYMIKPYFEFYLV